MPPSLATYFATVAPPGPPPTTTTFGFACANAGMGNVEAASAPMPPMNCLLFVFIIALP